VSQVLRDYVPLPDRCDLRVKPVTLNGKPAVISGLMEKYATVTCLETGEHYQWSWPQVEYVITEKNGAFRS
jgi:hypothetical protein